MAASHDSALDSPSIVDPGEKGSSHASKRDDLDLRMLSIPPATRFEPTTLDPAHPRAWYAPVATFSGKVYQQLLGLNPFKTSYMSLYGSLETRHDKLVACGAALLAIAAGVPLPVIGVVFGKIINAFPPSEEEMKARIMELLGVAVAYFLVTAAYATLFSFAGEKIAFQARERVLKCLLHVDQAYLDTHEIDVNSLLSERVDAIHAGCSEKAGIFIQSISYFVAAFTVGFILSPMLTGILLAAVIPILSLVVSLAARFGSRFSKEVTEYNEAANGVVESALRSINVVQAFGMMTEICATHTQCLLAKTGASVRKALIAAGQVGSIYFTIYSINGLAFYVGSRLAASGQKGGNAGTVFAVVFLILDSSLVVAQFAPILETFAQAAAAQEAINALLDASLSQHPAIKPITAQHNLRGLPVELRDVTFAYPARPTASVLNGLSMHIRPAATTALVGTSGGGKSTLVSLLTAAYGHDGSIKIGPYELRDLDIEDLRSQLAVVEQDHVLFTGTIYDNIVHGVRNLPIPDSELRTRCEQAVNDANIDFLDLLPRGIHTRIGDGLQLSGGQQQRICLARALVRKPAFLILDEPTSALDARSEVAVMSAVHRAAASGITVLMVAHRLSTVLDTDHVIVLCEGKVVEQGEPKVLSQSHGVFESLLKAQRTDPRSSTGAESTEKLSQKHSSANSAQSTYESDGTEFEDNESMELSTPELSIGGALCNLGSSIRPDLMIILLGLLGSILNGGLLLGEAVIFGNLVQLLNAGTGQPHFQEHASFFCLMFFVLGCIALVSWVSSGTAFGVASTRSVARIQSRLLHRLLYLDMQWFARSDRSVHRLMSIFTKDSGDLSCLSGPALGTIFTTATSMMGGIVLGLIVAWKIAVVLLAAVPVMLAAGFTRIWILGVADRRRRNAYCNATSLAAEACRHRRTVSVYGLESYILDRYRKASQRPFKKAQLFIITSNILLALSFAITYFVYALAYWWGAKHVRSGEYTGKQFFIVLPALLFCAQSSGQLFSLSPELARAKAAATNILKLLKSQPHILNESPDRKIDMLSTRPRGSFELPTDGNAISVPKVALEHVSLAYSSGKGTMALRDVSLNIDAGTSVGLVGPSGAGKSTIINLMERFYDPTSGTVKMEGHDVRQLDVKAIRDRIGLVSQEAALLPGSMAHNIRLGAAEDQEVSDADIEGVCRRCGLHSFISSLPDGYNTECGSASSSRLSGGQRQRLALARALVRNPDILLLDEPTSALDAHSEQQVQAALTEASKGRTTITVAHRLASVMHADKIFVFDEGMVKEEGTHAQLIAIHGGLYASMASAQSLC